MAEANNSYDPAQSYTLLLASTLAYINYTGIPKDAEGYINIGHAIKTGALNLEQAIDKAGITIPPRKNAGVRKMVSYLTKENLDEWSVKVIDSGMDQALVIKHKDQLIASFRGTEPKFLEWCRDFNAGRDPFAPVYARFQGQSPDFSDSPKVPHPIAPGDEAWVHAGFEHATNGKDGNSGIASQVEAEVKSQMDKNPKAKFYITGHSLGAAMALLYATETSVPVTALYNYGQPRVGNQQFCDFVDSRLQGKYFRIVNDPDLVTEVPPHGIPGLEYVHTGEQILLHDRPTNRFRRLGKDMEGMQIRDHQPFLYAGPLYKNKDKELPLPKSFLDRVLPSRRSGAASIV